MVVSGTAAAFISYQQSKLWSKHPEEYGHGSIEGVAANEAAQNAAQAGECVPTFGLGIPAGPPMVMVLAACLIHGFVPGPDDKICPAVALCGLGVNAALDLHTGCDRLADVHLYT
jgi:TctA family transporter